MASPVSEDFLDLFEHRSQATIKIVGADAAFEAISSLQGSYDTTYRDFYFPVDVEITYKGQTYTFEEAGIRMKGNTSRTTFFHNGHFTNPVHYKISFKATFDDDPYKNDDTLKPFYHDWSSDAAGRKARKKRNFLGLEKLDLKYVPRNGDGCSLREVYVYDAFRQGGLMAPYATLSPVTLHSDGHVYQSTYEIVEPIDKEFLKRRFSKAEAAGDLYKCVYNGMGKADFTRSDNVDESWNHIALGGIGVEDNYNHYAPRYQLKTNDDDMQNSDFSKMCALMKTLWECTWGGGSQQTIDNAIDMEEFLRFSAMSFLFGNPDDQRYNYNNFYTYFRPSDGKAMFIPYDWDWCLGLDFAGGMESRGPLDSWTLGGEQSRLYDATLFNASYDTNKNRSQYLGYVGEYKDGALNFDAFRCLAEKFGNPNASETASVEWYMGEKRNHCN